MKQLTETIEVQTRRNRPCRFTYRGRRYNVLDLLDYWVVQGRWWAREERRIYFRVRTATGIMEMYRSDGSWRLSAIVD